ncbi:endonuclease/exonuclease/phosphatase family protein [Methylomarinum sp. Ch1-1]|uniref:Endonuclease/exonuclease/phosphatase family protein n=1 Tax=Methylomarinum roseum TaxID=3067653 RepID=A0AAU7NVG7_9GAMM|nr:endonuclease/exonuclease/phosphatase family protein [Methylomarinum sp. Ch1-1]MDP4522982.1 endonuclease/exonuclease/phosphatase family protein [Methylomarinum sp. Ch1-1]
MAAPPALMILRIATFNIHRSIGRDGIENPARIAELLREIDADLIALQEVSAMPGHPEDSLRLLEEATNSRAVMGRTLFDKNSHYGNALLSRLKINSCDRLDISVANREPRGLIDVELFINGYTVAVMATHLGLAYAERRRQIDEILSTVEKHTADVVILLGDFNEWFVWRPAFRRLQHRFKPTPTLATFPAHRPVLGLDRIWLHPQERLMSLEVHSTELSKIASDHLPLVAEIDLGQR